MLAALLPGGSGDFQSRLAAFGLRGHTSRKGDAFDNAVTESLFGSLKAERLQAWALPPAALQRTR